MTAYNVHSSLTGRRILATARRLFGVGETTVYAKHVSTGVTGAYICCKESPNLSFGHQTWRLAIPQIEMSPSGIGRPLRASLESRLTLNQPKLKGSQCNAPVRKRLDTQLNNEQGPTPGSESVMGLQGTTGQSRPGNPDRSLAVLAADARQRRPAESGSEVTRVICPGHGGRGDSQTGQIDGPDSGQTGHY